MGEDVHRGRNEIVGASADALTLLINGREETRSWNSVVNVSATITELPGSRIFAMVISFDDDRLFVVGEPERAWGPLVDQLHVQLPNVEAFTNWGPRLLAKPDAIELYVRA